MDTANNRNEFTYSDSTNNRSAQTNTIDKKSSSVVKVLIGIAILSVLTLMTVLGYYIFRVYEQQESQKEAEARKNCFTSTDLGDNTQTKYCLELQDKWERESLDESPIMQFYFHKDFLIETDVPAEQLANQDQPLITFMRSNSKLELTSNDQKIESLKEFFEEFECIRKEERCDLADEEIVERGNDIYMYRTYHHEGMTGYVLAATHDDGGGQEIWTLRGFVGDKNSDYLDEIKRAIKSFEVVESTNLPEKEALDIDIPGTHKCYKLLGTLESSGGEYCLRLPARFKPTMGEDAQTTSEEFNTLGRPDHQISTIRVSVIPKMYYSDDTTIEDIKANKHFYAFEYVGIPEEITTRNGKALYAKSENKERPSYALVVKHNDNFWYIHTFLRNEDSVDEVMKDEIEMMMRSFIVIK